MTILFNFISNEKSWYADKKKLKTIVVTTNKVICSWFWSFSSLLFSTYLFIIYHCHYYFLQIYIYIYLKYNTFKNCISTGEFTKSQVTRVACGRPMIPAKFKPLLRSHQNISVEKLIKVITSLITVFNFTWKFTFFIFIIDYFYSTK